MSDSPFVRAAQVYRDAGWEGVLPLPHNKKWAPPEGFTGDAGGWPDDEQIAEWVADTNRWGNIALRLPDGVIGLDVDHHGPKKGADTISMREAQWGELPRTWVSSARPWPSGIRLFRAPPGKYGSAGAHIDTIQRHHRYVCAWPSTNPQADNAGYRWMSPDGTIEDRPPSIDELAWLPDAWVEGLRNVATKPATATTPMTTSDTRSTAVDRALANALANFYAGRHDAATSGVMALVRLMRQQYPGADEGLEALRVAFINTVVGDGSRTEAVAVKEWDRMVATAETKVASSPSTIPVWEPWRPDDDHSWEIAPRPTQTAPEGTKTDGDDTVQSLGAQVATLAHIIDWDVFWSSDQANEDWLVYPLIPRGRAVALYAPAKAGKSSVVLAAVAAAASGRPVFGGASVEPIHTLYLDYEMTSADLQERLDDLGYGPDDDLTHLHYAVLPSLPPLDTKEGATALLALASHYNAELVVVDTFGRAVQGEENDNDTVRNFYRLTGLGLKAAGIAVLRTDHSGKDLERGQRGASAKADDVDVVWQLTRAEDGTRLKRTHSRVEWVPESIELARHDDGGSITWKTRTGSYPAGTKEKARMFDQLGIPLNANRAAVRRALKEAGQRCSTDLIVKVQQWRQSEIPEFIGKPKATPEGEEVTATGEISDRSENGPGTYPQPLEVGPVQNGPDEKAQVRGRSEQTVRTGQGVSPINGPADPISKGSAGRGRPDEIEDELF